MARRHRRKSVWVVSVAGLVAAGVLAVAAPLGATTISVATEAEYLAALATLSG